MLEYLYIFLANIFPKIKKKWFRAAKIQKNECLILKHLFDIAVSKKNRLAGQLTHQPVTRMK